MAKYKMFFNPAKAIRETIASKEATTTRPQTLYAQVSEGACG